MRYQARKLRGFSVGAADGDIGSVKDVLFDDEWWGVRYFVVDTGSWLKGREVLISVQSLRQGRLPERAIPVELTRDQVENSPPVDTDLPISRHYERAHGAYYHNHYYWNGPHAWAAGPFATLLSTDQPRPGEEGRRLDELAAAEHEAAERSHLRSSEEVIGYVVYATDGSIGHIDDLLIDGETWRITHLVVDTRDWWPGGQVILPPEAVDHVDWSSSTVRLKWTRDRVKSSPGPG